MKAVLVSVETLAVGGVTPTEMTVTVKFVPLLD